MGSSSPARGSCAQFNARKRRNVFLHILPDSRKFTVLLWEKDEAALGSLVPSFLPSFSSFSFQICFCLIPICFF
jgi:hypothetical protein